MQLKFAFFFPVISRSFSTDNRMVDPCSSEQQAVFFFQKKSLGDNYTVTCRSCIEDDEPLNQFIT